MLPVDLNKGFVYQVGFSDFVLANNQAVSSVNIFFDLVTILMVDSV